MSRNRSHTATGRTRSAFVGWLSLLLCACGQQAGGDYRGEPLLHMRGQAVVSALTGGQAIEPALCFFLADRPEMPEVDSSKLPSDLREELSYMGESQLSSFGHVQGYLATHILDVESVGEFPAQFDVEVYLPPPSMGLSKPWVAGESRQASGFVCAVAADHPAVTFPFAHGGMSDPGGGHMTYAILSMQTPRFYYESYDCPAGTLPQYASAGGCTKTSRGEPAMALEFSTQGYQSESVLGVARGVEVLYLDEAAAPGSFTAFQWGAENGLSAGYHLFAAVPFVEGVPPTNLDCSIEAMKESERVNSEQLNERIQAAMGDDWRYNGLMAYSNTMQQSAMLPEDIFLEARETESRLMMKHCPLEPRQELDPNMATLSIDMASNAEPDLSKHFGIVTIVRGTE